MQLKAGQNNRLAALVVASVALINVIGPATHAGAVPPQTPPVDVAVVDGGHIDKIPAGGVLQPLQSGEVFAAYYDHKGDLLYNDNSTLKEISAGGTDFVLSPFDTLGATAIAFDNDDNAYLLTVDQAHLNSIVEFSAADIASGTESAGQVVVHGIAGPVQDGLAVDASGNFYVSELNTGSGTADGKLLELGPDGTLKRTLDTTLSDPRYLAIDAPGNILLVDEDGSTNSGAVYEYGPSGTRSTIAANIEFPTGIAVDGSDNVYVGENNRGSGSGVNQVVELRAGGSQAITLASGVDSITSVSVTPPIVQPASVNTGSSDVFVSDTNGVYRIAPPLSAKTTIDSTNTFQSPIAEDDSGNLYEGNAYGDTIAKVSHDGTYIGPYFSDPDVNIAGEAFDNEGDMYANVRDRTDPDGTPATLIKIPAAGGTTSTTLATGGFFNALTVDSHDNVYDYDGNAQQITEFESNGTTRTLPVAGPFGLTGISVDTDGNLWTVSYNLSNTSIVEYPADGSAAVNKTLDWKSSYGTFGATWPLIGYEISTDGSDNIFIAASLEGPLGEWEASNGIWEKAASSSTFHQITQTDLATTTTYDGDEVGSIATARNAAPSLPPAEAPPSITGTVTDSAGNPVTGATVSAFAPTDVFTATATATTASDGTYALAAPAGNYDVAASRPAGSDLLTQWYNGVATRAAATSVVLGASDTPDVDFDMAPGGSISGTVTDNAAHPLAGVTVYGFAPGDTFVPSAVATTAADGTYVLHALATTTFDVAFVPPTNSDFVLQWYNHVPSRATATGLLISGSNAIPNVDAQFAAAGSITGTVTQSSGAPVGGVTVRAFSATDTYLPSGSATTAANGTYAIHGLPGGSYRVNFAPATGSGLGAEWFDNANNRLSATAVTVSTGAGTTVNSQLNAAAVLSGTVLDTHGNPVAGATVKAFTPSDLFAASYATSTAADGTYSVVLPAPGTYKVNFSATGFASQWYHGAATRATATPINAVGGTAATGVGATLVSAP